VDHVWLAIGHVISALLKAMTIIGIPFAIQHLKLAGCALAPAERQLHHPNDDNYIAPL